jgi:AcrR family transcriptional regulator
MKNSDPERRREVLAAAERLLRHYGPGKTTIGDIAREAGIGVGSVYLEFCSKNEIVAELARQRHDRVLGAMRHAARAGTYAARLSGALEARVETLIEISRDGAHACDLVSCTASAPKTAYGRFRAEELVLVAELLDGGAEAGEFDLTHSHETAELLQLAYASFSPPWISERDEREVLHLVRGVTKLILSGLCSRKARRSAKR